MSELTEYEKKRAERINENKRLLEALEIKEASEELIAQVKPKSMSKSLEENRGPVRRSSRLNSKPLPSLNNDEIFKLAGNQMSLPSVDIVTEYDDSADEPESKSDDEEYRPAGENTEIEEISENEGEDEDVTVDAESLHATKSRESLGVKRGRKKGSELTKRKSQRAAIRGGRESIVDAQSSLVRMMSSSNGNSLPVDIDEEEMLINQAIAMSLEMEPSPPVENLETRQAEEQPNKNRTKKKTKQKQGNAEPPKLTLTEVDELFFLFDQNGRGRILASDVTRVAMAHNVGFSGSEIQEMVALFSSNGNDRLTLKDFHKLLHDCGITDVSKTQP